MENTDESDFCGNVVSTKQCFRERFSYYGMRAILVLYLTAAVSGSDTGGPGLDLDDGTAIAIYGAYSGLVYLTPIAGGWIADRMLGAHTASMDFTGVLLSPASA